MYTRVIKVLEASIKLLSNIQLITYENYFSTKHVESLLSDFGEITDLSIDSESDSCFIVLNSQDETDIIIDENKAIAIGDFFNFEQQTEDKRYTLLGNQGLLYRLILSTLERKYGIYSFHANALYNESSHELTIFFGGAGSGKSPALMAGLCKDLKVFGTELVHFSVKDGDLKFYRSACLDNIRPQSIHEDFPELSSVLNVPSCENFHSPSSKFLLDLRAYAAQEAVLKSPTLRLIIPKVEMGRYPVINIREKNLDNMTKLIFDNLSEKIGSSFTMYNRIAVPGFDNAKQAFYRLQAARLLIQTAVLQSVELFIAPARYFIEVL